MELQASQGAIRGIASGVALAATGVWLIVAARRLPETSNPEEEAYWRGTGK